MQSILPGLQKLTALGLLTLITGCAQSEIGPATPDAQAHAVAPDQPTPDFAPGDWRVLRVAGDPEAELEVMPGKTKAGDDAPYYRAGRAAISAALADGYAPPTPPGAIELKVYAPYRQAIVETQRGEGSAFWPLFQHIQSRDIAMTAPVVMTGAMAGDNADQSSMAFLYRSPELGPTGEAERGIIVEDTPHTTVLSMGFIGRENRQRLSELRTDLDQWLADQQGPDHWVIDGEARLLGYNGPDTPRRDQWWELQLPVRWATDSPE
ncbi:MAG: heme-binding protein [Phycisphaeraceae bacterium]